MTRRHNLARLFADRRTRRISFIKRDGAIRWMTFRYQGGPIVGSSMTVWDLEADAHRKINLSTIQPGGVVLRAER